MIAEVVPTISIYDFNDTVPKGSNLVADYGSVVACCIKFPTGAHSLKRKPKL